jgi:hypothetical protein
MSVTELSTQPEFWGINVLRSRIPVRSDQMKGRPVTSKGELPYSQQSVFPEEPITSPNMFIFNATLDASPGRVPRSLILAWRQRMAYTGDVLAVGSMAKGAIGPEARPSDNKPVINPFAELPKESAPAPSVPGQSRRRSSTMLHVRQRRVNVAIGRLSPVLLMPLANRRPTTATMYRRHLSRKPNWYHTPYLGCIRS